MAGATLQLLTLEVETSPLLKLPHVTLLVCDTVACSGSLLIVHYAELKGTYAQIHDELSASVKAFLKLTG